MAKKLKIALLAPFEEPVPPRQYGGTERVVFNIAEELIKLGHDVTLLASGDSRTSAKLEACVDKAVRVLPESVIPAIRQGLSYAGLSKALFIVSNNGFDILHNHYGWQFLLFRDLFSCPVVTTLHGTLAEPTENYMHNRFREEPFVSISDSQRKHSPKLNYVATVHNGIQVDRFTFNNKPKNYLAFLGRIHPQKGPEYAIKIAKLSKQKLIMAAKIDPLEIDYFKREIEPLIDGKQIQFIGEVDHKGKVELLRNARALLSPIQWDEPFGLTNIESLACGTPVISMNRGSLPEIIINGEYGYLCSTITDAVNAVSKIDAISRSKCRKYVEENFSAKLMAEKYLEAYKKVLRK